MEIDKEMITVKAAPMTNRPEFNLMKQTDILLFYHIQIPRWMFYDKRYKHISNDAKIVYGLLLNRFQLSKMNGWMNEDGEIFLVYTRRELSGVLDISYGKTISCMKELKEVCLVWERRCGRGDANQIYLAHVEHNEEDALQYDRVPSAAEAVDGSRTSNSECLEDSCGGRIPCASEEYSDGGPLRTPESELLIGGEFQGVQSAHILTYKNGMSRTPDSETQDIQNLYPSYIDIINTDNRDIDSSQSVGHARTHETADRQTDDLESLEKILEGCDLWIFKPETAKVFQNAIERLWFSKSYRIGNAVLPQRKVRSHMHELDSIRLQDAEKKIASNTERVIKNTTAYVMAVIFNTIWEVESDVMADPYLNSLRQGLEGGAP